MDADGRQPEVAQRTVVRQILHMWYGRSRYGGLHWQITVKSTQQPRVHVRLTDWRRLQVVYGYTSSCVAECPPY